MPPSKKSAPKKKAASRKKETKNKPKNPEPERFSSFFRSLLAVTFLLAIVISAAFTSFYFIKIKNRLPETIHKTTHHNKKSKVYHSPVFEIYPEEDSETSKPSKDTIPPQVLPTDRPAISVIIDDLGYDKRIARKFLKIDKNITFSILPHSPFQNQIAKEAYNNGTEIMLHLPMEPLKYPVINSGPGTIFSSMPPDELIHQLELDLDAIPFIIGVNNHMGSKITTNSSQIYQIFSILKKRNLFFIDSRTTSQSICKPSARLFKLPFAERSVFLDNKLEIEAITTQLERLVQIAERDGSAIGIGHPHLNTCKVLTDKLPELSQKISLVPASKLVKIIEP